MRAETESIASLDGEVIIGDVRQTGVTGRAGGKVTEVFEEADERVLVVIVHVCDDASLRDCLLGGRVCHLLGFSCAGTPRIV